MLAVAGRVKRSALALSLLAAFSPEGTAQTNTISDPCSRTAAGSTTAAREWCIQAAQAVSAAQPQVGILAAAGNPLLGAGRPGGGFRLGILPQASLSAKLNLVQVRLTELRTSTGSNGPAGDQPKALAPAVSGTAMIGVFPGVSLAPMLGGIGSVDLLAQATYLPVRAFGTSGFDEKSPDLALAGGVRIGILRESFLLPGVAVSAMYRRLGDVRVGNVCPGPVQAASTNTDRGYTFEQGSCVDPAAGDPAEIAFDLENTSLRAVASKRLLLLGLAAGVGYDRWTSDLGIGFRAPGDPRFFRASGLELRSSRWSAFANGVLSLPLVALAIEAGWMEGGAGLADFGSARSQFDPDAGTWFGSLGVRLSL